MEHRTETEQTRLPAGTKVEGLHMSMVQDTLAFVAILAFSAMVYGWGAALTG
jgi:hypothetical protein